MINHYSNSFFKNIKKVMELVDYISYKIYCIVIKQDSRCNSISSILAYSHQRGGNEAQDSKDLTIFSQSWNLFPTIILLEEDYFIVG